MFGTNPISKVDLAPEDGKLAVQEVFYTLQGEGPHAGKPAVFIRLAGCHLACTFCDTEFTSGINNRMTPEAVAGLALAVLPFGMAPGLVVLTGGEPMRQATGRLLTLLRGMRFWKVQYETAGNLWDPSISHALAEGFAELVVSPKVGHIHPIVARYTRHYKYVVTAGELAEDGLPEGSTQANGRSDRPMRPWDLGSRDIDTDIMLGHTTVWVSPCDLHDQERNRANVKAARDTCMKHGYRLSLQMHKIVELP